MVFFTSILVLWIISVCLHEYAHARVALAGGDTSVIEKGYLTLNPLRYVHPVTSILIPVLILAIGGVPLPGGAVYIDTSKIRSRGWLSLVSAAGPLANLLLLVLAAIPFLLGLHEQEGIAGTQLISMLALFAFLMGLAAALNLLPIPGLDGFGIIEPFLPYEARRFLSEFGRYSIFILLAIFLTDNPVKRFLIAAPLALTEALGIPMDLTLSALRLFHESGPF